MSQGLQVWDAWGALVMDTTTINGLVIGNFVTSVSNGSLTDSRLGNGVPFIISAPLFLAPQSKPPVIWVSGNTIYWEFPPGSTTNVMSSVIYGVS